MTFVRIQHTASVLLMLVVTQCSSSSSAVYHDYIVVGAGPGGLQLGYFLERAGRDYVILERADKAGACVDEMLCVRSNSRVSTQDDRFLTSNTTQNC